MFRTHEGTTGTWRGLAALTAATTALAGALVATTGVSVAWAPQATAAPGNPGVPSDPIVLFDEDFENAGDGANVLITDYEGAATSYTADPPWADRPNCNGFVIDATSPQQADDCSNANAEVETPTESFDHLQGMTTALGEYAGDPSPETNSALASYTANQTDFDGGLVAGEAVSSFTLPEAGGYLQFTANFAGMNCDAAAAVLSFYAVDSAGNEYVVPDASGSQNFQPCSGTPTDVTTPDGEDITVNLGTFTSSLVGDLPAGETFTLRMRNGVGAGVGNDVVVDDVQVEELGPQLDKEFDPAVTPVGTSSTLTFTITNSSDLGAKPAYSFTDTLPDGLVVASPANATDTCGTYFWGPSPGSSTLTVNGPGLAEGVESCTITVDVTSETAAVYSNGPDDIADLTGLLAPADATVEFTDDAPEPGLEITKTADVEDVAPGGTVEYTVEVENTGDVDYTADDPATFTDDLTEVLDDATYDDDATADVGTVDTTGLPTLNWSGALPAGETATITYSVTVDDPVGGDGVLTNAVTGPDESSCVEGTEDGCTTDTPVRSLQILKTADPDEELVPGETIEYTITVTNDGQVPYTADDPAGITDDLSAVVDDATYDGDASADIGTVDDSALPELTWSGPLDVGATATITYTVTVDDPGTGDGTALNTVTGPPESNCVTGDEDGCQVTVPPRSLDITKTADVDDVVPGGTVTYTVTVENTGEVDYTPDDPATFTDDLTDVLDDATYDDDATASAGSTSYTEPTLSWSGPLAVGDTATVTYSVTVDDVTDDPGDGDGSLVNVVTPDAASGGGCVTDGACSTVTPVVTPGPSPTPTPTPTPTTSPTPTPTDTAEPEPTATSTPPSTPPPSESGTLPRTGADVAALAAIASALLAAGALLLWARRRRGPGSPDEP